MSLIGQVEFLFAKLEEKVDLLWQQVWLSILANSFLGNKKYCSHTSHFPKSEVGTVIKLENCQQNIARAVCGDNQIWLVEKCNEDGKCKAFLKSYNYHFYIKALEIILSLAFTLKSRET